MTRKVQFARVISAIEFDDATLSCNYYKIELNNDGQEVTKKYFCENFTELSINEEY